MNDRGMFGRPLGPTPAPPPLDQLHVPPVDPPVGRAGFLRGKPRPAKADMAEPVRLPSDVVDVARPVGQPTRHGT